MAVSAFIVHVPEAEPCVGKLRERYDASARLGVPAHITLLFPFMDPGRITDAVLRQAQQALAGVPAFGFSLATVARFAATAYLAPEPAGPFIALTQSLAHQFPAYPPFGGAHADIVPHLSVANGDAHEADAAERALVAAVQAHGPIRSRCTHVTLLGNAAGRWQKLHDFALQA
jgi:2'-5' RNA ligase